MISIPHGTIPTLHYIVSLSHACCKESMHTTLLVSPYIISPHVHVHPRNRADETPARLGLGSIKQQHRSREKTPPRAMTTHSTKHTPASTPPTSTDKDTKRSSLVPSPQVYNPSRCTLHHPNASSGISIGPRALTSNAQSRPPRRTNHYGHRYGWRRLNVSPSTPLPINSSTSMTNRE